MAFYDAIGKGYDATRRADPYIVSRLLYHLKPKIGSRYLYLACGSGNYTLALKRAGLNIAGIDVSERMLLIATRKEPSTAWFLGDIEFLPFRDGSFAGAICVLSIHHLKHLHVAFKEAARVIESGPLVIFTATAEQMEGYWLKEYFPQAMRKSIVQMPEKVVINEAFKSSGFQEQYWETYEIRTDLQDFFLYAGRNRPEIYLDAAVRHGISTFSALADPAEVEKGCKLLESDIRSGRISQVIDSYANKREGDYMFVVGGK